MNYGYILQEEKNAQTFSVFHRLKINYIEAYQTCENTLNFFYLPYPKNVSFEEKCIKKLVNLLKYHETKHIAFESHLSKYIPIFQDTGFCVTDGSLIKKHLLVQAFFSYLKTNKIDTEKTGIHLCVNTMNDIDFFFDKISKINAVFSMCTENEKFYGNILNKYGIAVHFSDNVYNKIIICHNGNVPYNTNSNLLDLSVGNYKISCANFPDLFSNITPVEAELFIKMNYSSCDTGFYDSGIKITYF